MDKEILEQCLKLLGSDNDPDAVMGLRGVQNLFRSAGASLDNALRYAADNPGQWQQSADKTIGHQPAKKPAAPAPVNMSGVPECRVPRAGVVEIVQAGKTTGDSYPLPGESAPHAEAIAGRLKDAVVAAIINKSRFKLKLLDVKNGRGEVTETVLQAEYDRPDMIPVRLWANSRGAAGALAVVLRKAVADSLPELAAA